MKKSAAARFQGAKQDWPPGQAPISKKRAGPPVRTRRPDKRPALLGAGGGALLAGFGAAARRRPPRQQGAGGGRSIDVGHGRRCNPCPTSAVCRGWSDRGEAVSLRDWVPIGAVGSCEVGMERRRGLRRAGYATACRRIAATSDYPRLCQSSPSCCWCGVVACGDVWESGVSAGWLRGTVVPLVLLV